MEARIWPGFVTAGLDPCFLFYYDFLVFRAFRALYMLV